MSWNKTKILRAVYFPAKAKHNKAVNPTHEHVAFLTAANCRRCNGVVSERIVFSYILC